MLTFDDSSLSFDTEHGDSVPLHICDSSLDPAIVFELTQPLPDRWHDSHPHHHLEINRKTRLVGDAA